MGINSQQIRELYKTIRNILRDSNRSSEMHRWTIKYLSTFTNSYENEDAATVQQEAVKAVTDAIKFPSIYQFDTLLDLFPVKQLASGPHSKVFQLLNLFVHDNVDSFVGFVKTNPGSLQSLGLDEQECLRKIRLLSLCSLGATNTEVSYSLIAKTLQIEEGDVESWVILAISESIIDAKLDQLKASVTIHRSLHRVFSRGQWKQLSDTLNAWSSNMQLILKTLQDCKQQQVQQLQQLRQQ